jgi:hypothetical protein
MQSRDVQNETPGPASGVDASDLELVRRAQRGERGAFDLLVGQMAGYGGRVDEMRSSSIAFSTPGSPNSVTICSRVIRSIVILASRLARAS